MTLKFYKKKTKTKTSFFNFFRQIHFLFTWWKFREQWHFLYYFPKIPKHCISGTLLPRVVEEGPDNGLRYLIVILQPGGGHCLPILWPDQAIQELFFAHFRCCLAETFQCLEKGKNTKWLTPNRPNSRCLCAKANQK